MSTVVIEFELPENCIQTGTIGIIQYLTSDGEIENLVETEGDLAISAWLGLLEAAKLKLWDYHIATQDDEDDDD